MKPAGIILAAGESRRMGRPKALLPFRGGTFLSVLSDTFRRHCDPVVAVLGFDSETVSKSLPRGVLPVVNPDYRLGMLTSLQCGLRACPREFDSVLFTLVDHPAVKPETLARLIDALALSTPADNAAIAIPRFEGHRGHPVLMRREIALRYPAERVNAKVRDVIDRHAERILYVEVPDPGICDDVDDPALYAALLARETLALEGEALPLGGEGT